jgi:hypothetical protein
MMMAKTPAVGSARMTPAISPAAMQHTRPTMPRVGWPRFLPKK